MRYELLEGEGPSEGWVTVSLKDKDSDAETSGCGAQHPRLKIAILPYYKPMLCYTMLYILCCTMLCYTVLSTVLYCTIVYSTILRDATLCYTIVYYIFAY